MPEDDDRKWRQKRWEAEMEANRLSGRIDQHVAITSIVAALLYRPHEFPHTVEEAVSVAKVLVEAALKAVERGKPGGEGS